MRRHRSRTRGEKRSHPQQLRHAPGLGDAAPRGVRQVAVEDLGDLSESGFGEMAFEWLQQLAGFFLGSRRVPMYLEKGGDVRPDEPAPDRALVICAVAAEGAAAV